MNSIKNRIIFVFGLIVLLLLGVTTLDIKDKFSIVNKKKQNSASEESLPVEQHEVRIIENIKEQPPKPQEKPKQQKVVLEGLPTIAHNKSQSQSNKETTEKALKIFNFSRFKTGKAIKDINHNKVVYNHGDMLDVQLTILQPGYKSLSDEEGELFEVPEKRFLYGIYIGKEQVQNKTYHIDTFNSGKSIEATRSKSFNQQSFNHYYRVSAKEADEYDAIVYLVTKSKIFKTKSISNKGFIDLLNQKSEKIIDCALLQYKINQNIGHETLSVKQAIEQLKQLTSQKILQYPKQPLWTKTMQVLSASIGGRSTYKSYYSILLVTKNGIRHLKSTGKKKTKTIMCDYFFLKKERRMNAYFCYFVTETQPKFDHRMRFHDTMKSLKAAKPIAMDIQKVLVR